MRSWKIIAALFLICSTAVAFESRLPFKTIFKGEPRFNRLVSLAKENNWKELPIGQRTAAVGQALIGTRYTASPSNENKMSDGGRDRASLEVKGWKSSQNVDAKRSAVRSIAWLDELS